VAAAELGGKARWWFHGVMRTVGGDGPEKLRGDPMEGNDCAHGKTDGADWIGDRTGGRLGRGPRRKLVRSRGLKTDPKFLFFFLCEETGPNFRS
jgi:hypothetical protein